VYNLLRRLGFSCLSPRPRHEKNDPAAMEKFEQDAPSSFEQVRRDHPDKSVRIFLMDEARFGPAGHADEDAGAVRLASHGHESDEVRVVYLYGAVDPPTGDFAAAPLRYVDTV
jgi:hypothetical protein